VRKGIKNELVAEIDADVDRFFALFADNVKRHGTPALPKRYFALLKEVFGADCEVLTVLHQGRVVSTVLTFYFRDEVLPYYAGDTEDARHLAANDYKYWELCGALANADTSYSTTVAASAAPGNSISRKIGASNRSSCTTNIFW